MQQQLQNQANQLCQIAFQNLSKGSHDAAIGLLERALQIVPDHALAHAYLGRAYAASGDVAKARGAFDKAIAAMPTAWGPRFEKAQFLEQIGDTIGAALAWRTGLQYVPDEARHDPQIAELAQRAYDAITHDNERLREHLLELTKDLRTDETEKHLRRYNHTLDITTGRRAFVTAKPIMVAVPELPAVQFFDREDFAWAKDVEDQTDLVLQELNEISANDAAGFIPYVQTAEGNDVGQFGALDKDDGWSAYFLWNQGKRVEEHCAKCPNTEAAINMAPQIKVKDRAPAVFFSALKPHTDIPPHNGATNARLTVHLPLIIPDNCALQVGDDIRTWKMRELLIFDDTIRHAAWNHSDERRVVLIFDVWNPFLSTLEQALIARTIEGMVDYYGNSNDLGEL